MLPERRLLTRKLNVLKCKGKTSRLACVTMRVFVEANLRLLVMGPGETSILRCVSTLPGQSLGCKLNVIPKSSIFHSRLHLLKESCLLNTNVEFFSKTWTDRDDSSL